MKKQVYSFIFAIFLSALFINSAFSQQVQSPEQIQENITIPNEVIVRMYDGMDPRQILNELPEEYNLKISSVLSKRSDIWLFEFDDNITSVKEVMNQISRIDNVWLVQPNTKVELRAVPNDPLYGNQWQHDNIDSEAAWDITTGGTTATGDDVVVCVIESVDVIGHPDLQNNRWINTAEIPNNGVDDDGNGYIDDYDGWNVASNDDNIGTGSHGTQVAGMIGAQGNNNLGVAGANWNVKIMVVAGYGNPFTQANIVEAYTYPMEARILWNQTNGADGSFVVSTNASWGVDGGDPNDYPIWCSFYDDLGQVGILNCGATTNQSEDVDTFGDVPTACASDYMVGVTATDINDQITFAGYGDQTINVAAPGDGIYTTSQGGGYGSTQGTSFASPLTAGVIGLMYSIPCPNFMAMVQSDPQGMADMVREALYDGVDQSAHLQARTISGGRINSKNSIDLLMAQVCGDCPPPSGIAISNITDNEATITYDAVTDAIEYTIYIQEAGTGTWTSVTTTNLSHTFTGLDLCTDYEYYVETECTGETSFPSGTSTFTTTGCPSCIALNYCASNATNPGDEWIDIFEIDTYTNNSGNDNGYGDYTLSSNISLTLNNTYNFTITPDWAGTLYDEQSRIWIDYNQNGTFEASELVYDQGTPSQNVVTGNITIPGTALTGSTRMRVQMAYIGQGQPDLPDVCGDYTWGETEDYCVDILSDQICNMSVSSTVTDPACNGVADGEIILNVSGGTPGYSYNWSSGETTSTISGLDQGTYSVVISDASSCDTTVNFNLSYTSSLTMNSTVVQPSCAANSDGSITASATGGPGITYQWTAGPSTALYDNLGAGNFEVTATASNGCSLTESYTLNYTSNLALSETITQPTCNNTQDGEVTVVGSGGNNITYQWTGGPSSDTWSGLGNGTYTVTATDEDGCEISDSYTLAANEVTPVAGFNASPSFLDVDFFNTSNNANTYMWDFGDGNTSTDFNPSYTYASNGTYTVCLTAYSDCNESTVCEDVTVDENDASIDENENTLGIVVYPNPANDMIQFEIESIEASEIVIYDPTGKVVSTNKVEGKTTIVNLHKFRTGLYIYQVKDINGNVLHVNKINVIK